jgi:hypothetical protein
MFLRQAASSSFPAAGRTTLGKRIHRSSLNKRWLTQAATAAAQQTTPAGDNAGAAAASAKVFLYPKSQAMFEKIIASSYTADQWRLLLDTMLHTLGRQRRAKEFYYDGFGGGKKGNRKNGATEEEAAAPAAPSAFDVKLVGFDATAKIKVIKGMCGGVGGSPFLALGWLLTFLLRLMSL